MSGALTVQGRSRNGSCGRPFNCQGSDRRAQSQPIAGSISGATQLSARRQTYQWSRRMPRACRKHAMGYGRRGQRDALSHSLSPYNLNYRKAKQTNTRRSQQNVHFLWDFCELISVIGAFPYLICVCVSQTQIEKKRLTRSRLPPKVKKTRSKSQIFVILSIRRITYTGNHKYLC